MLELTKEQKKDLSEIMVIYDIIGDIPIFRNKYGERIQDWDEYGKAHAHRIDYVEGIAATIFASNRVEADRLLEDYKSTGMVIHRVEEI